MSQLPPEFDDYQPSQYDPQFTADISMLMHVPDRIEVAGEDDTDSLRQRAMMPEHMAIKNMVVPDKIIMLGKAKLMLLLQVHYFCLITQNMKIFENSF